MEEFFGLGLHVILAVIFAIHAVRTGREYYWLLVLFLFPMLGSVLYFFVEFLPDLRTGKGLRLATQAAVRVIDPSKERREAERTYELTPTIQNRVRLAHALLANGDSAEAVAHFDACLQGPFAQDPEIRQGAAMAKLGQRDLIGALALLESLQQQNASFRPEAIGLLQARCLAALQRHEEAQQRFEWLVQKFGSVESRAEYALWAAAQGQAETARRLQQDLQQSKKHWNRQIRALHQPLLAKVDAAIAQMGSR